MEEMGVSRKQQLWVKKDGMEELPLVMRLNMGINHQVSLFFTLCKD